MATSGDNRAYTVRRFSPKNWATERNENKCQKPIIILLITRKVAKALVKLQDLHEGIWGILFEFGLQGTNIGDEDNLIPAAIVPVVRVGLQRFDKLNSLSVDAAEVNPAKKQETTKNKALKQNNPNNFPVSVGRGLGPVVT